MQKWQRRYLRYRSSGRGDNFITQNRNKAAPASPSIIQVRKLHLLSFVQTRFPAPRSNRNITSSILWTQNPEENIQTFAQSFPFLAPKQASLSATESLNTLSGSAKAGITHNAKQEIPEQNKASQHPFPCPNLTRDPNKKVINMNLRTQRFGDNKLAPKIEIQKSISTGTSLTPSHTKLCLAPYNWKRSYV